MLSGDATQLLKKEVRRRIRQSLRRLAQCRIDEESEQMVRRFTSSDVYRNASSLALYASMPHEFNTKSLLIKAFEDSKQVFLPRVISKRDHEMVMLQCNSMEELYSWRANSWNIREPPVEKGRRQTPRDVAIDVIVVPGVAFDVQGRRCGQGMGFYDRFLTNYDLSCRRMPILMCLALSVQMVDIVPTDNTDWKVDEVIHGTCDT